MPETAVGGAGALVAGSPPRRCFTCSRASLVELTGTGRPLAEVDLDRIGCHHINDLRHPRYVAKRYSLEAPAPTPRPSMVVNAAS
jgi:hypothetical protein